MHIQFRRKSFMVWKEKTYKCDRTTCTFLRQCLKPPTLWCSCNQSQRIQQWAPEKCWYITPDYFSGLPRTAWQKQVPHFGDTAAWARHTVGKVYNPQNLHQLCKCWQETVRLFKFYFLQHYLTRLLSVTNSKRQGQDNFIFAMEAGTI